jgi:hypothetical protein
MTDTLPTALDSAVPGPLLPGPGIYRWTFEMGTDPSYWVRAQPLDGDILDNFFQQLVAGVLHLPVELVRPRWQPEPVPLPELDVDWVAIGITNSRLNPGFSWEGFEPDQTTQDGVQYRMLQHEQMDLLVTSYGPHAGWSDGILRDGLAIAQNREALQLGGFGLVEVGNPVWAPELINRRWLKRVDRTYLFNRIITRNYPVRTVIEAAGNIIDP